jgi:hypothetical protein
VTTSSTPQLPTGHNITLDNVFRDQLARALVQRKHLEIAREIDVRFHKDDTCGGPSRGAEACGGCRDCVYAQNTWTDLTGDGWARWQAYASDLITSLRIELAAIGHTL